MTRNKKTAHAELHARGENCVLTLSVVCTHVLRNARPVLLASRDEEGLALACGKGDHHRGIDDWAAAHAFHFTAGDPAMGIVRTLRRGDSVRRARVGAPWRRTPTEEGDAVTDL